MQIVPCGRIPCGNRPARHSEALHGTTRRQHSGAGCNGAAAFTGSVTDYYDSDANPLFELEIGGRTVLVPAAEEFIAHIDFGGRTMKLVLPEGLLDL